eukprot:Filipodium_phascolosomae@DN5657_c0_g1_i1.p1
MGGEDILDVTLRPEVEETMVYEPGAWEPMHECRMNSDLSLFHQLRHLKYMRGAFRNPPGVENPNYDVIINKPVIALSRYEYANIYHTSADFYNVFLLLKELQLSAKDVYLLFLDGHPKGGLDPAWRVIFENQVGWIHQLTSCRSGIVQCTQQQIDEEISPGWINKRKALFKNLTYSGSSHECAVLARYQSPGLEAKKCFGNKSVSEYRRWFLGSLGLSVVTVSTRSNQLMVTVLLRRNHLVHPRNPSGKTYRKFKNENGFLSTISKIVQSLNLEIQRNSSIKIQVQSHSFETITMREQLEIISQTDVFVGIHGAGLALTVYQPDDSSLIELLPQSHQLEFFEVMGSISGVHYYRYVVTRSGPYDDAGEEFVDVDSKHFGLFFEESMRAIIERRKKRLG